MKTLAVVGPPDSGSESLVDGLARRLGNLGRVATVVEESGAAGPDGPPEGVDATYRIGGDGWTARGTDPDLGSLLDDLAPDHDYVVLQGFADAPVPTVVLGDASAEGPVLASARDADAVDVDEVIEALRDVEPRETLESLVAKVKRSPDAERAGAIATFTGRVRARDGEDDEPTEFLEFEKYEGVAADRMERIESELSDRDGVQEVVMHHRTGRIDYGEDIVFVVVLAGHREEAFRTVEDGINRLKDEVPIFKREVTVEEEFWVHQRD